MAQLESAIILFSRKNLDTMFPGKIKTQKTIFHFVYTRIFIKKVAMIKVY